nr:putative cyclin-A3-1 [Ipomoea batatas]
MGSAAANQNGSAFRSPNHWPNPSPFGEVRTRSQGPAAYYSDQLRGRPANADLDQRVSPTSDDNGDQRCSAPPRRRPRPAVQTCCSSTANSLLHASATATSRVADQLTSLRDLPTFTDHCSSSLPLCSGLLKVVKVEKGDNAVKDSIDSKSDDPQMCSAYVSDIYEYLRQMEAQEKRRPLPDYLEKVQKDISANMRGILVDWLVEVAEEYKLLSDTL